MGAGSVARLAKRCSSLGLGIVVYPTGKLKR